MAEIEQLQNTAVAVEAALTGELESLKRWHQADKRGQSQEREARHQSAERELNRIFGVDGQGGGMGEAGLGGV